MRRAARRDDNDSELVQLARRLGADWYSDGPMDGWLHWRGRWVPVEIKRSDKEGWASEFTEKQLKVMAAMRVSRAPFVVWRTADDVLRTLGIACAA